MIPAAFASRSPSPELRFLLALVRAGLGRGPWPAAPARVDEAALLALVTRHRLAPLLHHRAADIVRATCPPPLVAAIQAEAEQHLRRALAQTAELFRLTAALELAGITVLSVKGPALAQQLHRHLAARPAGDLDLVVAPVDVARADAILQHHGLRRSRPDFALTPRQMRAYLALKPEFEYHRTATPALRVELLWRLEGLELPVGTTSVPLAGRAAPTLALADHALYLFEHGARHAWFRLFWLVDIAVLLERRDLDWAALLARARTRGAERAVRQGTALAADLLAAPVPRALQTAPADPALVAEAQRQILRDPRPNESAFEWARQLHYRTQLHPGAGGKWRTIAPHLLTPNNWPLWRLPDRWFWLYYPATPFLWLWRYLHRP
jgi:hypothetical protein